MKQDSFKVYGYRWIVLVAFMFIVAITQLLWITFAPITGDAAKYYQVSDLSIGLLSMSFMIVYIIVSIPASWIIDTYGIRVGVGIGAVLTAVFGLLRGVWASNYTLVLIAQVGVAIGQPFVLNAITTVAARWFPSRRARHRLRAWVAGDVPGNFSRADVDPLPGHPLSDRRNVDRLWDCLRNCRADLSCVCQRTPGNTS